ncbi:MAG: DedA family protein [Candidatus Nanohaloarchaea archaeon]
MEGLKKRTAAFTAGVLTGFVPGYLQGSNTVDLATIIWRSPLGSFLGTGYRWLQGFIEAYGISAFIAVSALKGLLLFVFAPAESVTPLYVLYAAENLLQVGVIVLVAAAVITASNFVVYLLSFTVGGRLFTERGSGKWRAVEWLAKKHGKASMFFLRLVPFVGGWAAIPAGVVKMDPKDFLVFSFLGFLTYEGFLGFAAYYGLKLGVFTVPFLPPPF